MCVCDCVIVCVRLRVKERDSEREREREKETEADKREMRIPLYPLINCHRTVSVLSSKNVMYL